MATGQAVLGRRRLEAGQVVADDVVIEGAGASSTIIDAGRIDRAFLISGRSAMSDLTIRRGRTAGAGAGISMRNGNLELSRVILTENEASRGGAALDAADGSVVVDPPRL